jgi:hypothetical protein
MWKIDPDGKIINTPDVGFDHFNDAVRYGLGSLVSISDDDEPIVEDNLFVNGFY